MKALAVIPNSSPPIRANSKARRLQINFMASPPEVPAPVPAPATQVPEVPPPTPSTVPPPDRSPDPESVPPPSAALYFKRRRFAPTFIESNFYNESIR
jgi:hypothetical protein